MISLGDAVAASNARVAAPAAGSADGAMDISGSSSCQLFVGENKENMPLRPRSKGDLSLQSLQVADDSIQSLIEKMHSSIEVGTAATVGGGGVGEGAFIEVGLCSKDVEHRAVGVGGHALLHGGRGGGIPPLRVAELLQ